MDKRKGKIVAKVIAIVIFLVILYAFMPYITNFIENPPSLASYTITSGLDFEFEREINIDAQGTYTLNLTIPLNNTFQHVIVEDLSGLNKDVVKRYNRTMWSYDLQNNANLKIVYRGNISAKIWNIEDSLDVDAIPPNLKDQYNHNESIRVYDENLGRYVNKDVIQPSKFRHLTEKLTNNDTNVVEKLRTIYDIIIDNFKYQTQRSGSPSSAVETWNKKEGDCDELSFVFVSMARSIGIPARVEYGLVYAQNTWGPHAWVNVPIPTSDGVVWADIDVTVEVGGENVGRGFLIRNADRLTEWYEDGNSQHLTEYYSFIKGYYTSLHYSEDVNVIKMNKLGEITIPVKEAQLPQWLMILIIGLIILAVFIIIIRY